MLNPLFFMGVFGMFPTFSSFTFSMQNTTEKKANIIIILTDDQGYGDFSCHGLADR